VEIEIFSLCDFANDLGGKLVIVGTFDTITAQEYPAFHPSCSIAARIRFERYESGDHPVQIHLIDQDGRDVLPPLNGAINVVVPAQQSSAVFNFCITIGQLQIQQEGAYRFDLMMDGAHCRSVPLFALKAPAELPNPNL